MHERECVCGRRDWKSDHVKLWYNLTSKNIAYWAKYSKIVRHNIVGRNKTYKNKKCRTQAIRITIVTITVKTVTRSSYISVCPEHLGDDVFWLSLAAVL